MQQLKFLLILAVFTVTAFSCSKGDLKISVTGVMLDATSETLVIDETFTLSVTILPENASNKGITWNSSNPAVASVKEGVVTGISEGFATITVKTEDGGKIATCSVNVINFGDVTDLSARGTANCYIVSRAGKFKFNATLKGSTYESLGTPSSTEVLWESFGTDVTPNKGDIVQNAFCSDGYITFNTRSSLNNGNAVIAVKGASGNILWSWHIWVCNGFNPDATAQDYNNGAGTMMDRNLGATSATPGEVGSLGLLYQWGRKDPFLGSSSISYSTKAKSTDSWPFSTSSTSSTGTFSYVEKNPMQFITLNNSNADWYFTGSFSTDNTRWQTSDKTKGKYDPCPPGWRVPDGGNTGIWSTAFGSSDPIYSGPWDYENYGMNFGIGAGIGHNLGNFGTIWYPAAGCLGPSDGSLSLVVKYGGCWSCTSCNDDHFAFSLRFEEDEGFVNPTHNFYGRASGFSVRCVKENNF